MLGKLKETEIDSLLKEQVIGRIGCHADDCTYVIPVNYVYDGNFIYCHSSMGQKIEMMRKNPSVCFEVDEIQSTFRWKSVIVWGRFEEITDIDAKQQAMQRLIHRIMPFSDKPTDHPAHGITDNESNIGVSVELILYRIKIERMTGRFEK